MASLFTTINFKTSTTLLNSRPSLVSAWLMMSPKFKSSKSSSINFKDVQKMFANQSKILSGLVQPPKKMPKKNRKGIVHFPMGDDKKHLNKVLMKELNLIQTGPILQDLIEVYNLEFTRVKPFPERNEVIVFFKTIWDGPEIHNDLNNVALELVRFEFGKAIGHSNIKVTFERDLKALQNEKFEQTMDEIHFGVNDNDNNNWPDEEDNLKFIDHPIFTLKTDVMGFDRQPALLHVSFIPVFMSRLISCAN